MTATGAPETTPPVPAPTPPAASDEQPARRDPAATTDETSGRQRVTDLGPAESRGELTMADQVVEKIATTALGEIDEIGGSARRVLGVSLGSSDPDDRPRVQARVAGQTVGLDVSASIAYPAPVAKTAARARAHVAARVDELTGMHTQRVDITVTALTVPEGRDGRGLL